MMELIVGIALIGSAIGCFRENRRMKSKPFRYLEDGTPVYLDRLCNEYVNGEKLVYKYNYPLDRLQRVGEISGRVYFDEVDAERARQDEWSEQRKQQAIANGQLAYMRYDHVRKKQMTCECSTDKFIAELRGERGGTYRKYYLSPNKSYEQCHMRDESDPGVEITQEEYDKLNIYGGTHSDFDINRETYQVVRGKLQKVRI